VNNQYSDHRKSFVGSDADSAELSRSSLQELMIDIFSSFACASPEDCETAIKTSLQKMAEYVRADRAVICEYDFARHISVNTYEWCAPGVDPQIMNSQAVSLDTVMDYVGCHLQGDAYLVEDVSALPSGPYKDFLSSQQILSFCTMPMMTGNECRGFVGFDSVHDFHIYSKDEKRLLRSFAQAISNFQQRQRAEMNLRHSEERHRGVAEDAPAMICEYLPDGTLTFVNQDYSNYHETPREEMEGTSFLNYLAAEHRDKVQQIYRSLTPEQPLNIDTHSFLRNGEQKWQEWRTRAFFDENGQAVRYQAVGMDITETKLNQEKIIKQAALINGLLDSIPDQVFYKDRDGIFMGCNTLFAKNLGLKKEEIIGSTDYGHLNEQKADEYHQLDRTVMENRQLAEHEEWFVDSDGQNKLFKTVKAPLLTEQNDVVGIVGITSDITNQWLLEESLLKAKEAAEEANIAKSQFLANMSHELRTPLHGMKGSLEQMKESESMDEIAEYLYIAEESTQKLQLMIDQVLDFSLIESTDLQLANAPFKMDQLLNEIEIKFQSYRAAEQVKFKMVLDETIPNELIGDTIRLKQVLYNLISNAAKFTHQGEIELKLTRLDQPAASGNAVTLLWHVKDTGIGIPPDNLVNIFDSFSQVDFTDNRRYGGTGLGLAICKKIITLMDGSIWVESEEGAGSTFYFTSTLQLPERTAGGEPVELQPVKPQYRLLAVDDDSFGLILIEKVAKKNGWLLTTATNGQEAVEACQNNHFDLILMDVQMPVMNGYEATEAIRRLNQRSAMTPVIAVTARALEGDREICLSAGMNDYLSKPFTVKEFIDVVERWCRYQTQSAV
jgi:PAS domain S-box-containing protein